MKLSFLKYLTAGVLALMVQSTAAQESGGQASTDMRETAIPAGPHSFHVEIAGRTFIFGSVNYEYALNRKFSVGTGLGVISILAGEIIRDNGGITETGNYLDVSTAQMIYGNYFIGKNRNQLVLTAGATNFLATYRNRYPSETVRSAEAQLEWNAGIGYQYSANQFFFRVTGYILSMPGPSDWFPEYIPWGGISTGWRLR
jgi:hypothetical protein